MKILKKKDLDERKKKVLQAIVEEYINTAEPVSSGSITKGHGLDYSSATIRNDMAQLENIGFLDKPHTSAGRVPSAEGYRYYVNELLKEDNLTLEEIKYIQNKLKIKVNEIEDLTKVATTTLSEITHYTTVAVGPKADKQIIEEIKFVSLGQRMLMVVIVTDTGLVKETIIKFDEDITESQVDTLNNLFNTRLRGKPLSKIDKPMAEYIFSEVHYSIGIMNAIINQINKIIEEENNNHRLYYITTKDFKTVSKAKLLYDPGFSTIDAVIVKRAKNDYVMVLKDNTRPERNLKIAFSDSMTGPYSPASQPFTESFVEGPSVEKVGDDYLIYFDVYKKKIYGAMRTKDFRNFTDVTEEVSIPVGHKHGTIFTAPESVVKALLEEKK